MYHLLLFLRSHFLSVRLILFFLQSRILFDTNTILNKKLIDFLLYFLSVIVLHMIDATPSRFFVQYILNLDNKFCFLFMDECESNRISLAVQ